MIRQLYSGNNARSGPCRGLLEIGNTNCDAAPMSKYRYKKCLTMIGGHPAQNQPTVPEIERIDVPLSTIREWYVLSPRKKRETTREPGKSPIYSLPWP